MAWQEDIQTIKYTSPSGSEFTFFYENLSVESVKKTVEFIFPEVDGAYVMDLGRAGRHFPFTIFFTGETYNKDADSFLLALEEKGIAKLEHPLYGNRKVVPNGSITRRDDLISEANQAVFTVTFFETIELTFPTTKENAEDVINNSVNDASETMSEEFANNVKFENAGDDISLKTQMEQQLKTIDDQLKSATKTMATVNSAYQQAKTAYENNIENIVDDAATLASQVINIIRLPSKVNQDIKLKIQTYNNLITHLKSDFLNAVEGIPNAFYETNKNIMACILASNESVLYQTFETRNQAIEASEMLLDQFDNLKDFQDQYIVDLELVDTGEGFDYLSKIISNVAGYLVSESFSLPSEKKIVLGNSKDIFSLVNEIYGNLDLLDSFIINNNLTCDEIEMLPALKEVVYYE